MNKYKLIIAIIAGILVGILNILIRKALCGI